jgi:Tfp pilus assembly protein PilF
MSWNRLIAAACLLALLSACASEPMRKLQSLFKNEGAPALSTGIRQYDDGNYAESLKNLQSAVDLGLAGKSDRIKAHKYMAFIHCVSGRERQCRDEFRKGLEIDPQMELEAAEAGHPIWGPVFRAAKARK